MPFLMLNSKSRPFILSYPWINPTLQCSVYKQERKKYILQTKIPLKWIKLKSMQNQTKKLLDYKLYKNFVPTDVPLINR